MEGNLRFKMGWASQLKAPKTLRKQLKTASTNSPWAYIREGLLSAGFLRLIFRGLIFGRAYFLGGGGGGLLSEFYGIRNKLHPN